MNLLNKLLKDKESMTKTIAFVLLAALIIFIVISSTVLIAQNETNETHQTESIINETNESNQTEPPQNQTNITNETNKTNETNLTNFTLIIEDYDGDQVYSQILLYNESEKKWKKLDRTTEIKESKHNFRIKLTQKIKEIEINSLEVSENKEYKLRVDEDLPRDKVPNGAVQVYAIDPSQLNFTEAIVTVSEAKGNQLWKCKTWDFEARECKPVCGFDAEKQIEVCQSGWQKLMDIVPGQEYSFTLTSEDPSYAEYNATLGAPQCKNFESPCIANSSLLQCNDNQAYPGPEPNQPNTIDTCTDSTTSGTCHSDESVENITITDLNSSYFRPGDTVNVTVWWYCYDTTDRIALYYTNSTSSINWVNKLAGTIRCLTAGYFTRNITFTLDNVPGEHAVRAIILRTIITSACPTGSYRDQDDVAFRVASKPVTTLNSPLDNYYNDSAPFVNVTFNCSATADVPLKNISLYITNSSNQSFSLNRTTNISGTSNSTAWTLTLGVGNYTWNCLTYDNASQFDWGDANRSLKINWTDNYPTVTLASPPNGNITISKNVNFTCNATDDIQLSNITFYWNYSGSWQANGTVAVSGTSNQTTFVRTNLSNGVILWNCQACDNASQCRFASTNWTVTINYTNTAPQYSNVGSNTTTPYTNEPVLHYAYWQDNDALSGYVFSSNYSGTWQNDSWQPLTGAANWSNVTKNAPSASGTYGWRIYANDSENAWNVTDTQIINVQNRAPQIALNLPLNNTQFNDTQNINFNFTATDDQNTTLSCSIYLDSVLNQTNSSTQNNTLTNFLISGISYGSHNWFINCSDGELSNVSEVRWFSIADTLAPNIQFVPPTESSGITINRNYIQINVTASDGGSGLKNITIYLYNSTGALINSTSSTSSPLFANFTNLAEGTYYFNATAYDYSNNSNSTETRNVTIYLNKAPQIALNLPLNNTQFNDTQNINFNFTATDDYNTTLSCSIYLDSVLNQTNSLTQNNTLTNFLITGISYGNHNWSINCSDGELSNVSEVRWFSIADTLAPNIQFVPPTESSGITINRNYIQINVTASDGGSGLKNITIYLYNSTGALINSTSSTSSPLFANFTNLAEGTYYFNATAYDYSNNSNSTETRNVSISGSIPIDSCQTLNTSGVYTLNQSVSSNGTCFNISANDIILDCSGYTINYSISAIGYGINNSDGFDNITIKNCNIVQGSSISYAYAIYGSGMANSTIQNNTITTSGHYGYSIYLDSSSTNTLSNNTITTSGSYGYGIYLYSSSNSNTLSNNTITTSGHYGYGIYLYSSSNSNTLTNNTITASGGYSYGIYLASSSYSNITGNKMNTANAYAIYVEPTTTVSHYNHTIDTTNTEQGQPIYYYFANSSITIENLYNIGQLYVTNSANITIRNITIINKDGIILVMTTNSSVSNSNITTSGSSSYGIRVDSSSTNNLSNNTITTSGSSGLGIYLYSSSTNTLTNNTIT
ncbi:MAG: right-handed parallel beta-helix repeat-containing protein, partial [Candidatus Pacearchaeota archaeon]